MDKGIRSRSHAISTDHTSLHTMISVSDAARFAEESISVKKFKSWWEIAIDYLVLGLLLLTLLSWTRVISAEASGLICVPLDSTISYSYYFAKYFNSRCGQEFDGKLLLYYPYLLFLQWVSLFLIQRAWLKVPAIKHKFESYYEILTEMYKIQPKVSINEHKHGDNQEYSSNNLPTFYYEITKENIAILRGKMLIMLSDKSYLFWVYVAKVVVLFITSLTYFCLLIYWTLSLNFTEADFHCQLTISFKRIDVLICHFSPAYLLYGIIVCNISLLFLILMLTFKGFCWMLYERGFLSGNICDCHSKLPGHMDLWFCMVLIKSHIKDDSVINNVVKTSFQHLPRQLEGKRVCYTKNDQHSSLRQTAVLQQNEECLSKNDIQKSYTLGQKYDRKEALSTELGLGLLSEIVMYDDAEDSVSHTQLGNYSNCYGHRSYVASLKRY